MEQLLRGRGHVHVFANEYKRYVGAQIGIYNPSGEKVGKVSHLWNKEFLYLVCPDSNLLDRAVREVASREPAKQLTLL